MFDPVDEIYGILNLGGRRREVLIALAQGGVLQAAERVRKLAGRVPFGAVLDFCAVREALGRLLRLRRQLFDQSVTGACYGSGGIAAALIDDVSHIGRQLLQRAICDTGAVCEALRHALCVRAAIV